MLFNETTCCYFLQALQAQLDSLNSLADEVKKRLNAMCRTYSEKDLSEISTEATSAIQR